MLEDFKRGIKKHMSVDDGESHFHLATAYREMALYEDAVREAAAALRSARDRKIRIRALEMLLTAPLLRAEGLKALRARLRMN